MSRSEPVVIDVTTRCPLVELVLIDPDLREVARGVGRLRVEVPIGIYELYVTAGVTTKTEIIPLRGDSDSPYIVDDYDTGFVTVTPADGPVADLSTSLSRRLSSSAGAADAGLVIVLGGTDHSRIQVVAPDGDVVSAAAGWTSVRGGAHGAWSGIRPPGNHLIRYRLDVGVEDVPVWLSRGWQTVVFIPAHGENPSVAATVMHLSPIDMPWQPDRHRDVLLEVMLDSGQRRQPPLPDDLIGVVRRYPDAPMLALAAVTLALKSGHPDLPALIDDVLPLLPDSPDIQALRFAHGDGETTSVSLTPTFATVFERVLLAADHSGTSAIVPGSPLSQAIPGLASDGPYITQSPEPLALADWVATHVPARSDPEATRHPLAALAKQADVAGFAAVAGLTMGLAHEAVELLQARADHSWLETWKAVGDALVPEPKTFTTPSLHSWSSQRLSLRLDSEWQQTRSEIRLSATSDLLPSSFPLLLSGPDDVSHLLNVVNGHAVWRTDSRGPFELRWPEADSVGELSAFEALSVEPELVPSFASHREPVYGRTIVSDGRLQFDTFEDDERNLELAVHSNDPQDAGAWVLVMVRVGDRVAENLVVPLSWHGAQKIAGGALRVGRANEAMKVFVVPQLQRWIDLDLDSVRRSLRRSADDATEQALRDVEARLMAADR